MLHINELTFKMMGRPLFDNASVVVPSGAKVGFVGRNGTGKTTLFNLITGELSAESGSIGLRRGARIGQVAQEAPGTDESLMDVVLQADLERTALLAEAEHATDPERIAEIHIRLGDIESHSAEARAGAILHGLGFDRQEQQRPCASFSGGWRMRVALAAVLFSQPDLLLLDEPTNYLDLEGTLWLENYIARYRHTAIIISHDRDLLNKTANTIIHLENRKLTSYRGNFDRFAKTKAEQAALQAKMKEKQDARRKHMQSFVDRFRAKASKARQAQSRLKALQKLGEITVTFDERAVPFSFPDPQREAASPIINMEGVSVGYEPGQPVLSGLGLRIDADDRIALLGANGNGKSTFAKLLSDRLKQETGTVTRADKLKVAMFAQHQLDDLIPEATPVEHLRKLMPDTPEAKVRGRVAQMGLSTEKMNTKAKQLSGGERARLLLGLATFDAPHLLILDEPTNHLDIDSRQALVDALNMFRGAVVLISHDRHLIEASAERLWLVHAGNVTPYDGDLDDYRRLVLKGPVKTGMTTLHEEQPAADGLSARERRKEAAARRSELAPMKKKISHIERKIAEARKEISGIEEKLTRPDVLGDSHKTIELSKKRGDVEKTITAMEEEWLALSTDYEEALGA